MSIKEQLLQLQYIIDNAAKSCHRDPKSVLLLAVSKQQPSHKIREAYHLGVHHFGENYYQEAVSKISELNDLPITWHFIGPIQSNKAKGIARQFSWVHSVDRLKIAMELNQYRPIDSPPLNVCLQIKLIDEDTKSGISAQHATELASAIQQLPNLKLRGLMLIPPPVRNETEQYTIFMQLNHLLQHLNHELHLSMDTLSMGMTDDLVPAIKAGATIIRIGRALFGERPQ